MNSIKSIYSAMIIMVGYMVKPGIFAEVNSIVDSAVSSQEVRHQLIADYEVRTNSIPDDQLLAVAVSYAVESNFEKAEPVYEKYLQSHPDNMRALRGIGSCYAFQKQDAKAAYYFKKGWQLGDKEELQGLAIVYLNEGLYNELDELRPSLIKYKSGNERIATCLIGLALSKEPPDEDLILNALEEIPDKDILLQDDTDQFLAKAIERLQTAEANNRAYQAIFRKVIRGYLADTNAWPKKHLLDVGDAYRGLLDNSNAEVLYKATLEEYPTNEHALLGLGTAELFQHKSTEAITPLRKAWERGGSEALVPLGAAYVMSDDFEGMRDLIPAFLENKQNIDNVTTLIAYSIKVKPPSKEIFYKAIDGLTDEQIARHDNMTDLAVLGFRYFGDEKRAQRLLKLKAEEEKGGRG